MRNVALITGITGQDGSYLAELLLAKGYEVHGIRRRSSSFNTARIEHILKDSHDKLSKLFLHYGDMLDGVNLVNLLREINPTEIYNLAAQSHVHISFTIPEYTGNVNSLGTIRLLESIRSAQINCKFYQASTSEIYGSTRPPQNEFSKFEPLSPYAASKLYSYWITKNYRDSYNIFAINGILFNHESPRRGETFVTRKISLAAARIAKGKQDKLFLGNIKAVRDWGYAPEYIEGIYEMMQNKMPEDYVLSTGVGATVEDFCRVAFDSVGLNYKNFMEIDSKYLRPNEVPNLIGDSSRIKNDLGWHAKTTWQEIAKIMVTHDLQWV